MQGIVIVKKLDVWSNIVIVIMLGSSVRKSVAVLVARMFKKIIKI